MTETNEPLIGGYNSHPTKTSPPDAAIFNRGAQTIEQINQAIDARREHSRQLGRKGGE